MFTEHKSLPWAKLFEITTVVPFASSLIRSPKSTIGGLSGMDKIWYIGRSSADLVPDSGLCFDEPGI